LAQSLNDLFSSEDFADDARSSIAPGMTPLTIETPGSYSAELYDQRSDTATSAEPRDNVYPTGNLASDRAVNLIDSSQIRIIADEENNALMILATPEQYKMIEATLRQLDIIPLQVLIQATLFEVTLTDDLDYGVSWFFQNGDFSLELDNLPAIAGTGGFSYFFNGSDFKNAVDALASVTDLRVISAPELMVLNNQSASMEIGDSVPVATRSSVSVADSLAPIVNDISYRDTGVILRVTPRVNPGGLVILDIVQEVSDVAPSVEPTVTPTIFQRTITSTVAVQSGESVALGGLIAERVTDSKSGVPILMDIPAVGNLFRSNSNEIRRAELIVIITPRVIRNPADARIATDELRRRMGAVHRVIQKREKKTEEKTREPGGPGPKEAGTITAPNPDDERPEGSSSNYNATERDHNPRIEPASPPEKQRDGEKQRVEAPSSIATRREPVLVVETKTTGDSNGLAQNHANLQARASPEPLETAANQAPLNSEPPTYSTPTIDPAGPDGISREAPRGDFDNSSDSLSLNAEKSPAPAEKAVDSETSPTEEPRPGYAVHLTSFRKESVAIADGARLKNLHAALLGDLELMTEYTHIADKGPYYRVLFGMVGQFKTASRLCERLRAAGEYCMVHRIRPDTANHDAPIRHHITNTNPEMPGDEAQDTADKSAETVRPYISKRSSL
jgi:hypothetical protein